MSLAYINLENIKNKPKFWLCKPNKSRIAKLTDIYNENLATKENSLSELSFTIPIEVERDHELIENPLLEKLKGYYLVEMLKDNKTEYFVLTNDSGQLSNDGVTKSYTLYSYEHKLAKKYVRGEEWVSKNLTQITLGILDETTWNVGSVPAEFDLKYRSFDVSTSSVLQCIYDIAEKFGAMVEFDTENKLVNYYSTSRGMYRGLHFKEGLYLESFDVQYDYDDIVTRLKVYGQDGLEFRSLTPTGSNYIQDFSWFMYPFECDVNYNVITKSNYMSDALCIALTKYDEKLVTVDGQFKTLVTQRTTTEDSIVQREEELNTLENQLTILHNELDVINSTYGDTASSRTDYQTCITNINNKKAEITAKETEINNLNTTLNGINTDINNLRVTVQMENNFTADELLELDDYIFEGEHTNDSISDEQDLLDEGLKVFEEMSSPTITLSMGIVNFLNSLENDANRKKLILGDTIRFKSTKLKKDLKARLSEINYDYGNDNTSITLSNERESRDLDTKIRNMIYGSATTSATFNMEKLKYNKAVTQADDVTKILESTFDATLHGIKGGVNDSTILNERGLYSTSVQDPNSMLVIQGGVLSISPDNLQSISVAINKDGVWADKLVGRIILSNKVHVEDDLGIVKIESGLQTIYDANGNTLVQLGKYDIGKHGLKIHGGAIEIVNGLPKSQIDPTAVSAWDSAETNAKSYADGLKNTLSGEISNVSQAVTDLETEMNGTFADGIISEAESISISKYVNTLTSEKSDIDSRYTTIYGDVQLVGDVKTTLAIKKTTYDTAHTNLVNSINAATTDGKATTVEITDVNTKFESYKTALSELSVAFENAINSIAQAKATKALEDANTFTTGQIELVNSDISDVDTRVTNLNTYVDGTFKDGVVTQAEKEALKVHIEQLNNEKTDLDAKYTSIYNDSSLSGAAKTNLESAKINTTDGFDKVHTDLINTINNAMVDNTITDIEKTNISNAFTSYRTSLNTLSTRFEEAIRSIEQVKASTAETNAKEYADTKDTTIRGDLRLTAPLPTNISLNADGITASNTTDATKFARMDYRGLYIQNGAIDIRTGTATNQGVIFDGLGIRGYNASGTKTFEIDTNGYVTANNGSFSGAINASSGSISGSLSVTGTLSGGTISGAYINGGTVYGATIEGGSITSNTSIEVTSNASIGQNIYLGNGLSDWMTQRTIWFNYPYGYAKIQYADDLLTIDAINGAYFPSGFRASYYARFDGYVDFSEATSVTWGSHKPTAVFG